MQVLIQVQIRYLDFLIFIKPRKFILFYFGQKPRLIYTPSISSSKCLLSFSSNRFLFFFFFVIRSFRYGLSVFKSSDLALSDFYVQIDFWV